MALQTWEAIVFVLFVVVGSIITASLYKRVMRGITTRKEERSVTRVGKFGKASEKMVRRK